MIEIRTARHLELRLGPSENGGVRRPLDGLSASWKRTRPDGRVTTLIINRPRRSPWLPNVVARDAGAGTGEAVHQGRRGTKGT